MSLFNDEAGTAETFAPRSAVGVAEIRHGEVQDQLSEYLDGSLDLQERARVDGHLLGCRGCRAYLKTLDATRSAVSNLPHERAPDSAKQRLLNIPEA